MAYNFREGASQYIHKINAQDFSHIALDLFQHQYGQEGIYRSFTEALAIAPGSVTDVQAIPFLPISFFKTHEVGSGDVKAAKLVFESSGTTGEVPSRHYVLREDIYRESLISGFSEFYGDPSRYAFLALLPSYLERKNASLVKMAEVLMEVSGHSANGFYLNEDERLIAEISRLEANKQPYILLGVTFALLGLAERYALKLNYGIVMETGGMKGRRKELTRTEVHQVLKDRWGLPAIHSEYGMTELLSQAYALRDGMFRPSPTMRVLVRDINDPLTVSLTGSGCLNIIDLANVDSCAFVATEDLGTVYDDGSFEVLGRMDHSALRGCSLMVL